MTTITTLSCVPEHLQGTRGRRQQESNFGNLRQFAEEVAPRTVTRGEWYSDYGASSVPPVFLALMPSDAAKAFGHPTVVCDWVTLTLGRDGARRMLEPRALGRWFLAFLRAYAWNPEEFELVPGGGFSGFLHSAVVMVGKQRVGLLAWGGLSQNGRVMLQIPGEGCSRLKPAAFGHLERMASKRSGKLTRLDIAVDWWNGQHSVEAVRDAWEHDPSAFTAGRGGRRPRHQAAGPWFDAEDPSGLTFYVGIAGAMKRLRAYQKGRQLRDRLSAWVRYEVAFQHHTKRPLGLELLRCESWLDTWAGAYPFLGRLVGLSGVKLPSSNRVREETVGAEIQGSIHYARRAVGSTVQELRRQGIPAEVICDLLDDCSGRRPQWAKRYGDVVPAEASLHARRLPGYMRPRASVASGETRAERSLPAPAAAAAAARPRVPANVALRTEMRDALSDLFGRSSPPRRRKRTLDSELRMLRAAVFS